MVDFKLIAERDARDRVTDRLHIFGKSAPIQNLPLPSKTLVTPFESQAQIDLAYTQKGVRYRLSDSPCGADSELNVPPSEGGPLILRTANITEDVTFRICALKNNGRLVTLNGEIKVRVGLDSVLAARILTENSTDPVSILDPGLSPPYPDDAPRIANYGSRIKVQIDDAQEGIDYTLEDDAQPEVAISQEPVQGRGVGQSIIVESLPLQDDVVIRVRAQRTINAAENTLLAIKLPMKLKVNPLLQISLVEGPVAAYLGEHHLRIAASHPSTLYQLFARPIQDIDYRAEEAAGDTLSIKAPGEAKVNVKTPPYKVVWQVPPGYSEITAPLPGNNGDLDIPLPAATADQVLLVKASKGHQRDNNSEISSAIRMRTATALLVRPNANAELALSLNLRDGALTMRGGEPGIYYYFRHQEEAREYRFPAYVHKRDPNDTDFNKGIARALGGGLTIGVDFALARSPGEYDLGSLTGDITRRPPLPPLVKTYGLIEALASASVTLYLRAKKAQTALSQAMEQQVTLPSTENISVAAEGITTGQNARFTVSHSHVGQRYQLLRGSAGEGNAQDGNGNDLLFESGPLDTDTLFVIQISPSVETPGVTLIREWPVWIRVVDDVGSVTEDSDPTEGGDDLTEDGDDLTEEGDDLTEDGDDLTEEGDDLTEDSDDVTEDGDDLTEDRDDLTEDRDD